MNAVDKERIESTLGCGLSEVQGAVQLRDWPYLRQLINRSQIEPLRECMDEIGLDEQDQARVLVDSGLVTAPYCGIDHCPCCMAMDLVAALPGYDWSDEVEHGMLVSAPPNVAAELVNTIMSLGWIPGAEIVRARAFCRTRIIIEMVP